MRSVILKSSVLVSLFLILLIIGYPNNSIKFSGYPLTATANEIAVSSASDDATGYISLGVDVADDGKVSAENLWRVRLFGPGMFYFYGSIIAIFGSNVQIPLLILLISACLWSLLIVKYYEILKLRIGTPATAIWISILLTCSWFSTGLLNDNLLGADNIGLLLFSAIIISVVNSPITSRLLIPGAILGLLTLMSARYYAILLFIALYFAFLLFAKSIMATLTSHDWSFLQNLIIKKAVIVIACAFMIGIPWRFISSQNVLPGSYGIRTSEYYWSQRWMTDEFTASNGVGFLSEGGANWACDIDPQLCSKINSYEVSNNTNFNGSGYSAKQFREMAISSAREHPLPFIINRASNFVNSWFGLINQPQPQMRIFQIISFFCLISTFFFGITSIAKRKFLDASVLSTVMLIGLISPFFLFHIEYRYLQNIQVMVFALFPFIVSETLKSQLVGFTRNRKTKIEVDNFALNDPSVKN